MFDDLQGLSVPQLLAGHVRELYWQYRGQQEMAKSGQVFTPPARSQWDGGRDRRGRRTESIWPKLVKFYWDHKFDPEACVAQVFIGGEGVVYPNQLMGNRWLPLFRSATDQTTKLRQTSLGSEREVCRQELVATAAMGFESQAAHWEFTLLNDELSLSPLFRLCVGHSAKLRSVVSGYLLPATVQYAMAADIYDQAWREVLPGDFRSAVRDGMNRKEATYARKA